MELTLKYFGLIQEVTGKPTELFEIVTTTNIRALKNTIENKYPLLKNKTYKIAINQTIIDDDFEITNNSEIAFLPPFAGG